MKDQLTQILDVYQKIGYSAVGVGQCDVRMGQDFWNLVKEKNTPVVQIDTASHDYEKPYLIKDVDGVKVGIISFGAVPQENDGFDLRKKRYSVYVEARKKSDILILLDQANVATDEWIDRNAPRLGAPDIVIGGTMRMALSEPKIIGKTVVCPTSSQGSAVGVAKIEYQPDQDLKVTFEKVSIDDKIDQDPEIVKILEAYRAEQAKKVAPMSFAPPTVSSSPNNGLTATSSSPNNAYYTSESCKTCHVSQYDSWKTTKHAQALQTLVRESKAIPECLPCHSEMFRKTSRLTIAQDQPSGVECASCHMTVLPHGAGYVKKGPVQADREACLVCHTKERSANFKFETYWDKAKHQK